MVRTYRQAFAAGVTLAVFTLLGAASAVSVDAAGKDVPLIEAVKHGDLAAVRALIAKKADVNAAESDGTTALHWAAHLNQAAAADLLIKAGANIKATTRDGATPFSLACYKGNAEVILTLLAAGEDAKAVFAGEPALMMVARAGNPLAVRALIGAGADPNVAEPSRGQTALMWAADEGNTAAIKVLLEGGANVNARSKGPATKQEMGGRIPRVNDPLGLRAHRDPTWAPNNNGLQFTPIMWASRNGHIETVKALLDAGANVNDEKPGDGTTCLLLAIENRHYELAALLLDRGANPNRGPGYTALHELAWTRRLNAKFGPLNPEATGTLDSLDLAKKLLDKGVEINAQMTKSFGDGYRNRMNRVGATAFLLSAKLVDVPMMKLLVSRGADIHITNADGDSPLMLAAGVAILNPNEDAGTEAETLDALNYLMGLGIDVNAVNNNKETALHGASYRGFNSATQLLVDHGAKIDVENILGWKPVTIADGLFFAGFFKAQPQTAALLREIYAQQGLPVPPPPKINDTKLLSLGERFSIGDVVQQTENGYVKVQVGPKGPNAPGPLLKVTAVDAQSQITETGPYTPSSLPPSK
jgi:ankyrin repeat protein